MSASSPNVSTPLNSDAMDSEDEEYLRTSSGEEEKEEEETRTDNGRPAPITDLAKVDITGQPYRGVYVANAPDLGNHNNKKKLAAYCFFSNGDDFRALYEDDKVKQLCENFSASKVRNFDVNQPKKYDKNGNEMPQKQWNPMTTFKKYFYPECVAKLGLDLQWIETIKNLPVDKFPLQEVALPSWFVEVGDKVHFTEYFINVLAYTIKFMEVTHNRFNDLWQPVKYFEDLAVDFTNEDIYRNYLLIKGYVKTEAPKENERSKNWTPIDPGYDTPTVLSSHVSYSKKDQQAPAEDLVKGVPPFRLEPSIFKDTRFTKAPAFYSEDVHPAGGVNAAATNEVDNTRSPLSNIGRKQLNKWLEANAKIQRRGSSTNISKEQKAMLEKNGGGITALLESIQSHAEEVDRSVGHTKATDDGEDFVQRENDRQFDSQTRKQDDQQTSRTPQYEQACTKLGYTTESPIPNGSDIPRLPHQTIAVAWAADKEEEAMRVLLMLDPCGFGKTIQCLDIVEERARRIDIHNKQKAKSNQKTYGVTLVIAPSSIYGGWADDAAKFYPRPNQGPKVITWYSQNLPGINNYSSMSDLIRYIDSLNPYDPATGRVVIATTYGTYKRNAVRLNRSRLLDRWSRLGRRGEPSKTDHVASDYDLLFKLSKVKIARIFLDEGHVAKNPTSLNSLMVQVTPRDYLYFVSATVLENSIEDVHGIIVQMDSHAHELGVDTILRERSRLKKSATIDEYKTFYTNYNDIVSYEHARLWSGSAGTIPVDWNEGFMVENGATPAERYGLALFSQACLKQIWDNPEYGNEKGGLSTSTIRLVVGSLLRMIGLARTRTTRIEVGTDDKGRPVHVTPVQGIPQHIVSTIDISPTIASDIRYQDEFAEIHSRRLVRLLDNTGKQEHTLDSGVERLLQLGSFCPELAYIGMKIIKIREFRKPKDTVLTNAEKMNSKLDINMEPNRRYPLPREWISYHDNCASALCLLFQNDGNATAPLDRIAALQILLMDAPKAIVLLREVLMAKRDGKKIIVFVTWPIQMMFLEAVFSLAELNVIALRTQDPPPVRRLKATTFNTKNNGVDVFLSMWSVGAHGINLQFDCSRMVICDIVPNVNLIVQMIGRLVRTGQKEPVHVSILSLDRTFDIKRQSLIANKMIGILATVLSDPVDDQDYADVDDEDNYSLDQRLTVVGDEYQRSLQGQACSRLRFGVAGSKYIYNFLGGRGDSFVDKINARWEKRMTRYREACEAAEEQMKDFDVTPFWPEKDSFESLRRVFALNADGDDALEAAEDDPLQNDPDADYAPPPPVSVTSNPSDDVPRAGMEDTVEETMEETVKSNDVTDAHVPPVSGDRGPTGDNLPQADTAVETAHTGDHVPDTERAVSGEAPGPPSQDSHEKSVSSASEGSSRPQRAAARNAAKRMANDGSLDDGAEEEDDDDTGKPPAKKAKKARKSRGKTSKRGK